MNDGVIKIEKGRITVSSREDENYKNFVYISLVDAESTHAPFVEVKISADNFVKALGRLGNVECCIMLNRLDRVGKILKLDKLEIEVTKDIYYNRDKNKNLLKNIVNIACPNGWEPDLYFDSKDSLFIKDNKYYVRVTIRQWLDKEESK